MQQRREVEIQDISYAEDKSLIRHKLSSQDIHTHIEGRRSLNNFQSRFESLTPLLSRPGRDAQIIQGAQHVCALLC
ncbi:hypothetical protein AHAS_Ahas12G0168600 [Arachis hypogaea]